MWENLSCSVWWPVVSEHDPALPSLCISDQLKSRVGDSRRRRDRPHGVCYPYERRSHLRVRIRRGEPDQCARRGSFQRVPGRPQTCGVPQSLRQPCHHILGPVHKDRTRRKGNSVPADPESQHDLQEPVVLRHLARQNAEVWHALSERDRQRPVNTFSSRCPLHFNIFTYLFFQCLIWLF